MAESQRPTETPACAISSAFANPLANLPSITRLLMANIFA
jgi:hypothetical protein